MASTATVAAASGPIVTSIAASAVSGEALVGQKITFTLAMSAASTVTGVPTLTLSNGGVASYVSGSGTNALVFQYVVAASNGSTSGLTVTGAAFPNGASIVGAGGAASLVGADQSFSNIVVDTTPVSAPVFTSSTSNADGSITIRGTAAPNTTVHEIEQIYIGADTFNLDGTAAVNASGVWTYTTPSLLNGTWYAFAAYDMNLLGDVSATSNSNGAPALTKGLASPIILSNSVSGSAVTLSGVIPTNYGATGPSGATVLILDGTTQIGSVVTTAGGNWTFTSGALTNGVHKFAVESQNAGGVSAPSLPVQITISQGIAGPVTVANYLANQAALDAAGSITIADSASAVASAIDKINADANVTTITLQGSTSLNLNVAQALGDTRAFKAITNAGYDIIVTDTGANVAANFDALNVASHISTILPTGGSQNLILTLPQILNDTKALALLDPFIVSVKDNGANLNALSATEISTLGADGVTQLEASDVGLTLKSAQRAALGASGITVVQPYASGTAEVLTFAASGDYSSVEYQGVTGNAYTSFTVNYGASGLPTSASFSNGMTAAWKYNSDGSHSLAYTGITGQPYTAENVIYDVNNKLSSIAFNNGINIVWRYNADNSATAVWTGGAGFIPREAMYAPHDVQIGFSIDKSADIGGVLLTTGGVQLTSGPSVLQLTSGADTFTLTSHPNEIINATGYGSETFGFSSGFGSDWINGFVAGGASSDVLSLKLSMFNGLSSGNTASQNVALLLSGRQMAQVGANVAITDNAGDVLTLNGITTSALTQNAASVFHFS